MFEEVVRHQARVNPRGPAVITPRRVINFQEFDTDIGRMALQLHGAARPRAVAALCIDGLYEHLVARIALARLGMATSSVPSGARKVKLELLKPDLVVCGEGVELEAKDIVRVGGWRQAAPPDPSDEIVAKPKPEDPALVLTSSGTTGAPKRLALSRLTFDRWLHAFSMILRVPRGARLASMMGLDTGMGAAAPFLAWMRGGAYYVNLEAMTSPMVGRALRPNLMLAAPAQLAAMLRFLPPEAKGFPGLSIMTGGAAVPSQLLHAVHTRLTTDFYMGYGTSEVGPVSLGLAEAGRGIPGAAGFIDPWATVEIVGPDGEPAPPGEVGEVRVRSPYMAQGYLDEAKGGGFRDGWFYAGDLGRIEADGMLVIEGRVGETLNLGGVKLTFLTLEEAVAEELGVVEAGACEIREAGDLSTAWIGVVAAAGLDLAPLRRKLRSRFGVLPLEVVQVSEIPRNAMGKVDRDRLAVAISAARR